MLRALWPEPTFPMIFKTAPLGSVSTAACFRLTPGLSRPIRFCLTQPEKRVSVSMGVQNNNRFAVEALLRGPNANSFNADDQY